MASSIFLAPLILLFNFLLATPATLPPTSHIRIPLKAFGDVYTMTVAIGTPPVRFSGIMDTGSDMIWTKCKSIGSASFDPSNSKSYSKSDKSCEDVGLGSDCIQNYQDGTSKLLVLGQETLAIGNDKFRNVTFGCWKPNDKKFRFDGIVGMGRGESSMVSQSKARVFSYCLGSKQGRSVLLAGSKASTDTQTMPLLKQGYKPYYYISLEGISVGETKLAVTKSDFAISNGRGGMIIDSGTTFTYLEKRIVGMISDAFMNQAKIEKFVDDKMYYKGLEHCFKPPAYVPNMVFHFEGANWQLPRENYIYQKEGADVACLAFIEKKDEDVSIFGNMQQRNTLVIYDLDKDILSFKPANCNQL